MALMGRKKEMVAHMINNRRARLSKMEKDMRESEQGQTKEVSEEEHKKRLELLKSMGLGIVKEEKKERV